MSTAMKKEQIAASSCYICNTYFSDRVRLGVHIARCYDDARARGEHWHPHPDILLDEVRYSQYMMAGERDRQFRDAEKKKVAMSTADDFSMLQSQIGSKSGSSPNSGRGQKSVGFSIPASQRQPIAVVEPALPPAKKFPTSTYQSDFHSPKQGSTPRSSNNAAAAAVALPPSPKAHQQTTPIDHVPAGNSSPSRVTSTTTHLPAMPPQQHHHHHQPTFAAPGVNTLRTELQGELDKVRNFMADEKRRAAERDAALTSLVDGASTAISHVRTGVNTSSPRSLPPPAHVMSSGGGGNNNNNNMPPSALRRNPATHQDDRNMHLAPIPKGYHEASNNIDRKPPQQQQQNNTATTYQPLRVNQSEDDGMRTAEAIHGGGWEAPSNRSACGRCGRMFAVDKVGEHEAVCVSKPSGIHRR